MGPTVVIGLSALLAGVGGAFAPALIRAVPEPEPAEPTPEPEPASAADAAASAQGGEPAGEGSAAPAAGAEGADPADASGAATTAVAQDPATAGAVVAPEPEPKIPYAELGARPGLAWRTALASAAAGALVAWTTGWDWSLLVLLPLVPVMVALAVIDWNTRLLPTWVIKPTYFLTIALVVVASLGGGDPSALLRAALGWLALGFFYFLLWFVNSGGLGYGDVRLSGVLGMAVGWVGWAELLTGAWAGFLAGGVIGGVLALLKVVDRRGVPFGPFMLLGVLLGLLFGPAVGARMG